MVILTLIKAIATFGMWGIVIWLAAEFGLTVGFAALGIIVCVAAIEAASDMIEEKEDEEDEEEDEEEEEV